MFAQLAARLEAFREESPIIYCSPISSFLFQTNQQMLGIFPITICVEYLPIPRPFGDKFLHQALALRVLEVDDFNAL